MSSSDSVSHSEESLEELSPLGDEEEKEVKIKIGDKLQGRKGSKRIQSSLGRLKNANKLLFRSRSNSKWEGEAEEEDSSKILLQQIKAAKSENATSNWTVIRKIKRPSKRDSRFTGTTKDEQSEAAESASNSGIRSSLYDVYLSKLEADRIKNEGNIQVLKSLSFMSQLADRHLLVLAQNIDEKTFPKGHKIIRQGSLNESIYFLLKGTVAVSSKKNARSRSEPERHHEFISSNRYFGEREFFSNDQEKSQVTVTAVEKVQCFVLSKEVLLKLAHFTDPEKEMMEVRKRIREAKVLDDLTLLESFTQIDKLHILKTMRPITYHPGEIIRRPEHRVDTFFIVVQGKVVKRKRQQDETSDAENVSQISYNQYFGEIALVKDGTSREECEYVAVDDQVVCLYVHRSTLVHQLPQVFSRLTSNSLPSAYGCEEGIQVKSNKKDPRFYVEKSTKELEENAKIPGFDLTNRRCSDFAVQCDFDSGSNAGLTSSNVISLFERLSRQIICDECIGSLSEQLLEQIKTEFDNSLKKKAEERKMMEESENFDEGDFEIDVPEIFDELCKKSRFQIPSAFQESKGNHENCFFAKNLDMLELFPNFISIVVEKLLTGTPQILTNIEGLTNSTRKRGIDFFEDINENPDRVTRSISSFLSGTIGHHFTSYFLGNSSDIEVSEVLSYLSRNMPAIGRLTFHDASFRKKMCSKMSLKEIEKGQFLFDAGDLESIFFLLLEGSISIQTKGPGKDSEWKTMCTLLPGSTLGELSLEDMDQEAYHKRLYRAQAMKRCKLAFITYDEYDFIRREYKYIGTRTFWLSSLKHLACTERGKMKNQASSMNKLKNKSYKNSATLGNIAAFWQLLYNVNSDTYPKDFVFIRNGELFERGQGYVIFIIQGEISIISQGLEIGKLGTGESFSRFDVDELSLPDLMMVSVGRVTTVKVKESLLRRLDPNGYASISTCAEYKTEWRCKLLESSRQDENIEREEEKGPLYLEILRREEERAEDEADFLARQLDMGLNTKSFKMPKQSQSKNLLNKGDNMKTPEASEDVKQQVRVGALNSMNNQYSFVIEKRHDVICNDLNRMRLGEHRKSMKISNKLPDIREKPYMQQASFAIPTKNWCKMP